MGALDRLGISSSPPVDNEVSDHQRQTGEAFGFKWAKRDTYDSQALRQSHRSWMLERYCKGEPAKIGEWLSGGGKIIWDVGCGAGFSALLFFGDYLKENDYLGMDISDAVDVARERFLEAGLPGDFLKADIMSGIIPEGAVDLIFAEGVLHHTDSVEMSLKHLASRLRPGGLFLFYVYRKKGPIREFTDDLIRNQLKSMSDQDAWEALRPLTRLGQALGELNIEIDVPADIPLLGIPKGRIQIQRFIYWHVVKAFYRPDLTMEEMNHINFDWFRPLNCARHTREEIETFCQESNLSINHLDEQDSGISVVALRLP
jgi:SAM-dependent methyltransferase